MGYNDITSGQLVIIKLMHPWELVKTSFRGDKEKNKYITLYAMDTYYKFGYNVELESNEEKSKV